MDNKDYGNNPVRDELYSLSETCRHLDAMEALVNTHIFGESYPELNSIGMESINPESFDNYYTALENSLIPSYDRLGVDTELTSKIFTTIFENYIKSIKKAKQKAEKKDTTNPNKVSRSITCKYTVSSLESDYTAIKSAFSLVGSFIKKLDGFNPSSINNAEKFEVMIKEIAHIADSLQKIISKVEDAGATVTGTTVSVGGTGVVNVGMVVASVSDNTTDTDKTLTSKELYDDSGKLIEVINKYLTLFDVAYSMKIKAAQLSKKMRSRGKDKFKDAKTKLKNDGATKSEVADSKYAKKATDILARQSLSVTRFLTLIMAATNKKLSHVTIATVNAINNYK